MDRHGSGVRFVDRREAGRVLAQKLGRYAHRPEVVVLALPRGGVPVGFELCEHLGVRLDVFIVRKLGVPGQEELAMGAIASGGVRVLNEGVIETLGIPDEMIQMVAAREQLELLRRERQYRSGRPPLDVRDKVAILVDDGLATGSTMRAAVSAVRQLAPRRIVVAVPVGAATTCEEFTREADEVVCAETPEPFYAVGQWYENFSQTTDEEVQELLEQAAWQVH